MTDDSNQSEAWADINPTTALVRTPAPQSQSLATRLQPASTDEFRRELTACLSLVAPSGMTESARREWLTIAWGTLQGIPSDLLVAGCKAAREKCDHPAKIVPAIMATVKENWDYRKKARAEEIGRRLPRPEPEFREEDRCTPEQAAAILAEFGLRRNPLDRFGE